MITKHYAIMVAVDPADHNDIRFVFTYTREYDSDVTLPDPDGDDLGEIDQDESFGADCHIQAIHDAADLLEEMEMDPEYAKELEYSLHVGEVKAI